MFLRDIQAKSRMVGNYVYFYGYFLTVFIIMFISMIIYFLVSAQDFVEITPVNNPFYTSPFGNDLRTQSIIVEILDDSR